MKKHIFWPYILLSVFSIPISYMIAYLIFYATSFTISLNISLIPLVININTLSLLLMIREVKK